MPFVLLMVNPARVDDLTLELLVHNLPRQVAEVLSLKEQRSNFSPDEVTIKTIKIGHFDRLKKGQDVEVIIFATNYPERVDIVPAASQQLAKRLGDLLPDELTGSVDIKLTEGGFATFVAQRPDEVEYSDHV